MLRFGLRCQALKPKHINKRTEEQVSRIQTLSSIRRRLRVPPTKRFIELSTACPQTLPLVVLAYDWLDPFIKPYAFPKARVTGGKVRYVGSPHLPPQPFLS